MHIRRVPTATKSLVRDGYYGYVEVADTADLVVGAHAALSAGALSAVSLVVREIAGSLDHPTYIRVRLDDLVTGQPFDASAYTVALLAELFIPDQTLWYGVGAAESPPAVYTDQEIAEVLSRVWPVTAGTSAAVESSVAAGTSAVVLLAANQARRGASIYNDGVGVLYLQVNSDPSPTSFVVKLFQDDYYTVESGFVGEVRGVWSLANGGARIVEYVRP